MSCKSCISPVTCGELGCLKYYRVNKHTLFGDLKPEQQIHMLRRVQEGVKPVDDRCGNGHDLNAASLLFNSKNLAQLCRECRKRARRESAARIRDKAPARKPGPVALIRELPAFSRPGLCGPEDARLFDPIDHATETPMQAAARHEQAASICANCPIVWECREAGLRYRHPQGVWGGQLVTA